MWTIASSNYNLFTIINKAGSPIITHHTQYTQTVSYQHAPLGELWEFEVEWTFSHMSDIHMTSAPHGSTCAAAGWLSDWKICHTHRRSRASGLCGWTGGLLGGAPKVKGGEQEEVENWSTTDISYICSIKNTLKRMHTHLLFKTFKIVF